MTKSGVGIVMLCFFIAIVTFDVVLFINDWPTFSRWMTDAQTDWPLLVTGGTSFAWGFLSGHWAWPMRRKRDLELP